MKTNENMNPQRNVGFNGRSVYVHLPFCTTRCAYCDFFSTETEPIPIDAYSKSIEAEWRRRTETVDTPAVLSAYIGGGTPSRFPAKVIGDWLAMFPVETGGEVTVEANPGDGSADWFRRLAGLGVNRFSIGVQALDDERLRFLGRRHNRDDAKRAIEWANQSGAVSVSADIIYGTPGQSPDGLERELSALAGLGVDHVSCYELTPAPGTPLGQQVASKQVTLPDDAQMVQLWQIAKTVLMSRGFDMYEVSNYALPGHPSRHNRHYWQGGEYIGLGLGAHGCLSDDNGRLFRYANSGSLESYLFPSTRRSPFGGLGDAGTTEAISPLDHARERMMLGLRTVQGAPFESIVRQLPVTERDRWRRIADPMVADGRLRDIDGYLVPTEAGLLSADGLAEAFF